ncbi:hypothetical protein DM02DRAFT_629515 [Periconia macrospinosa]|uniref:Uncharacterized protein n=1 Tax=Periconia macrospinosa TaxID=97972 RepID=A0A2V1DMG5_9PLEO|nr:hypothetical protein DM02DRAFT_629515 [Periconia macrospinosa]
MSTPTKDHDACSQTDDKSSTFRFLSLPAEIRLKIYPLCANPLDRPFSEYKGLYLSCRQIYWEMDVECTKIWKTHLGDWIKDRDKPNTSFRDLRNPVIEFDFDKLFNPRGITHVCNNLNYFFPSVHLDTLTLKPQTIPTHDGSWYCGHIFITMGEMFMKNPLVNIKRFVVEFDKKDQFISLDEPWEGVIRFLEYEDSWVYECRRLTRTEELIPVSLIFKDGSLKKQMERPGIDMPKIRVNKRLDHEGGVVLNGQVPRGRPWGLS